MSFLLIASAIVKYLKPFSTLLKSRFPSASEEVSNDESVPVKSVYNDSGSAKFSSIDSGQRRQQQQHHHRHYDSRHRRFRLFLCCIWLLHFSPVASFKSCREMSLRPTEERDDDRFAPVAIVKAFIPVSPYRDQYAGLPGSSSSSSMSSSSSGNVRSFHRESVLLRLDHDQRRYCYRWHEESASFWLRKKPHRRRFDEALYRAPKQWFRKVRAVDATGVGRWVLKPLLTDQNRICCRRCCSEEMASITVVDEDSSGSSQTQDLYNPCKRVKRYCNAEQIQIRRVTDFDEGRYVLRFGEFGMEFRVVNEAASRTPPVPPRYLYATDGEELKWNTGDKNRSLVALFQVDYPNPAVFWAKYIDTRNEKEDGNTPHGANDDGGGAAFSSAAAASSTATGAASSSATGAASSSSSAAAATGGEITVSLSDLIYSGWRRPSVDVVNVNNAEKTYENLVKTGAFDVFRAKDSSRIHVEPKSKAEVDAFLDSLEIKEDDDAEDDNGDVHPEDEDDDFYDIYDDEDTVQSRGGHNGAPGLEAHTPTQGGNVTGSGDIKEASGTADRSSHPWNSVGRAAANPTMPVLGRRSKKKTIYYYEISFDFDDEPISERNQGECYLCIVIDHKSQLSTVVNFCPDIRGGDKGKGVEGGGSLIPAIDGPDVMMGDQPVSNPAERPTYSAETQAAVWQVHVVKVLISLFVVGIVIVIITLCFALKCCRRNKEVDMKDPDDNESIKVHEASINSVSGYSNCHPSQSALMIYDDSSLADSERIFRRGTADEEEEEDAVYEILDQNPSSRSALDDSVGTFAMNRSASNDDMQLGFSISLFNLAAEDSGLGNSTPTQHRPEDSDNIEPKLARRVVGADSPPQQRQQQKQQPLLHVQVHSSTRVDDNNNNFNDINLHRLGAINFNLHAREADHGLNRLCQVSGGPFSPRGNDMSLYQCSDDDNHRCDNSVALSYQHSRYQPPQKEQPFRPDVSYGYL